LKIGKIQKPNEEETFGLINNDGQIRLVLKAEIQRQKGFNLLDSLEDFVLRGYASEVKDD
jgi:hypothetical protein